MNDPLYLLSTVYTLTHSLHYLSVYDALDAYATFVNRITAHADLLQVSDTPPALAFLSAHKDSLARVLRRDVRRVHLDPLSTKSPLCLDQSSFTSGLHPHTKITSKQLATNTSSLCHYALRALTVIFRFPAFCSVFSEHDLSSLFGDVLDVTLAGCLQDCDRMETLSHSLCTLSCHRLPAAVLISRQSDVFSVLHRGLDSQPANIILDGLKAISHTMELCPSAFLHVLSPLLPRVMASLFCESLELRLHASIVLCKFANALLSQSELSLMEWKSLSNYLISFLESHCDKSQADSEDTSFSRTVRMGFPSESHSHPRLGPTWMFVVLASLIVLCGPTLYKKPPILRSILQSLALALTHKRSVIRAMHPHVWKCFVWTFGRMLLSTENVEPAVISFAFYAINQEVSGGIGFALVNVLLSDRISAIHSGERGERVSWALSVIKEMVQTECKHTRREGLVFLQAFANNTQARHQITQNMDEIPASILFSGVIIGVDWSSLPSAIHSIPKVPVTVHWLEETEVAQHYKALLVIWKLYAIKVDKKELDSCLVGIWLFILLACSQQLKHGQLVPTSEVLGPFAATITEILPSALFREGQPGCGSWNVHDQLSTLAFIDKLWSAVRQAFVPASLAEAAASVLTSILKNVFHVLDLDVRASWSRFCASLIVTPSPSLLRDIHVFTVLRSTIQSQPDLWGVVATSLSSSDPDIGWKELSKFLCIPMCSWVLSDPELKAWDALFRNAITTSGDSVVISEILQFGQGKEVENWESIIPVLGFILTSTREHGHSPSDELLSLLNVCLTASYSRARHSAEALTPSLELLNAVRCMIVSVPGRVACNVHALSSSLCLWIKDHAELMSDDEFNSVVVPLYCETLEALAVLPLSIQSLQDTEDFLASAFSRIPTPAIAPFSFENFWRATYHGRSQFHHVLPPKIKSCLTCFVAAYGGDLTDGLSLTTESQSQSINDGSQAHFPTDRRHQIFRRSNPLESPLSMSIQAGARSEVIDMEVASLGHREVSTSQEDTTFLVPSPDDAPQPAALHQKGASRSDVSAQSPQNSLVHVSPTSPSTRAIPTFDSSKKFKSVTTHALNQKRKLADDAAPRKRSRISRATLRAFRKLESEPATRNVTPTDVPRMNSVPPKKRMVFDGVQVPTLRSVIQRQKMSERVETSKDAVGAERCPVFLPKTPTSRGAQERGRTSPATLPSSVGSDEENFDWEDFHIDGTPSEVDVDQCLEEVLSYPLQAQTSAPHGNEHPSGTGLLKAMSQNEISLSPPPRPSLRRAKTTSARLDALQDVYSAVANGASQIPMSELVQATRLVHRIGAVLTDQMGKKMGGQ